MSKDKNTENPDQPILTITGTVLRAGGGAYEVDPHDRAELAHLAEAEPVDSPTLLCSVRGLLKHGRRQAAQPVSVGDNVRVRVLASSGADARGRRLREGQIEEVLPRRSALARSRYNKTNQVSVANLDQVVIVLALREPDLNLHRLDRFLVLAEAADLRAVICLNKADLVKPRQRKSETKPIIDLYNSLGYKTLLTSAETDLGIDELRAELRGHISAVLGSSGVGKSSLINAVQPGLHLWIGDVMEIGKGRHTTTEVSLHPLNGGGYIADTPGIKTVSLMAREEIDVAQCFPELAAFQNACRFSNCTHDHEPGCAVREAASREEIAPSRYDSYLKILRDPTPVMATRQ
ncbi:MAG TPA: ribosome small subunit-dependent GTPase A [Abditibacteriaceae bacterium]|jgi:ribosome biogenesis GTPase